jgi:hypothetical protein
LPSSGSTTAAAPIRVRNSRLLVDDMDVSSGQSLLRAGSFFQGVFCLAGGEPVWGLFGERSGLVGIREHLPV